MATDTVCHAVQDSTGFAGEESSVSGSYVHGYDAREARRLQDQAGALVDLLHGDTRYADGSEVLEVGCGTGAQTPTLARRSPGARITAIDVSAESLDTARAAVRVAGLTNVRFQQADLFAAPFGEKTFDHVFVCFVLEHLARPVDALVRLRALLRDGGTMTVIEGDHGSAYFCPDSAAAHAAIQCQVELQRRAGGNAMIGRQVYPLMVGPDWPTYGYHRGWYTSTRAILTLSMVLSTGHSPR